MFITKSDVLKVPGANIFYEVRGSGPMLLLVSGGCGDADANNSLVDYLADKFTVVTYDRRGYARSKIDDQEKKIMLETESDDIHYLLTALSAQATYVLGSSIGAVIAMDFVVRYPEQVCTLIAHEPPAHYLTSLNKQPLSDSIQNVLKNKDVNVAMKTFAAMVGVSGSNVGTVKNSDNAKFFIQMEAPLLSSYRFDFDALKSAKVISKIIIAGGKTSPKDSVGYLGAIAISEQLQKEIVDFPGDHAGMGKCPEEFAKRLYEILGV